MKSLAEKNKELHQNLFDLGVIILIIKNICDSSDILGIRPEIVDMIFILTFLGLIGWKLMTQSYTKWQVCLLVVLILLCAYSCVRMSFFYLIFTILCIAGIQDVDLKISMNRSARTKLVIIAAHALIYFACIFVAPQLVTYSYRVGGVPRYTFFIGHANTFGMYTLWAVLELIFSNYEKLSVIKVWLLWLLLFVTYLFTDSNTGMIVGTTCAVLVTIMKIWPDIEYKLYNYLAGRLFTIFSIIFIITSVSYTKLSGGLLIAYKAFNAALTGRLMFGACAYDLKGFSIIGKQLSFPKKFYWYDRWMDGMVFDNSYIWLFVSYGIVFMILIAVGFYLIRRRLTAIEAVMIISYCLYGVMENYILNSVLCFPILLIGKYIFEEKPNSLPKYHGIYVRKKLDAQKKGTIANGTEG